VKAGKVKSIGSAFGRVLRSVIRFGREGKVEEENFIVFRRWLASMLVTRGCNQIVVSWLMDGKYLLGR
jgi:hypothetical protein